MATDFDNAILSSDGFIPTKTNTPLDKRTRIESINEMPNIPNPFVGMIVYVSGEDKYYKIKTLKSKVIGGITVQNAQVDSYEVFESGSGGGESITVDSSLSDSSTNPVQNKVIKAELDKKAEKSDIPSMPSLEGYATTQSVNNAINAAKAELSSEIEGNSSDISTLQSSVGTLATKVSALSGIDSPFVGYFDAEGKLPAQDSPAWALVGDLTTVKPYAYYVNGSVPSGFNAGWNDLSGALGTYDFTSFDFPVFIMPTNMATYYDTETNFMKGSMKLIGNKLIIYRGASFYVYIQSMVDVKTKSYLYVNKGEDIEIEMGTGDTVCIDLSSSIVYPTQNALSVGNTLKVVKYGAFNYKQVPICNYRNAHAVVNPTFLWMLYYDKIAGASQNDFAVLGTGASAYITNNKLTVTKKSAIFIYRNVGKASAAYLRLNAVNADFTFDFNSIASGSTLVIDGAKLEWMSDDISINGLSEVVKVVSGRHYSTLDIPIAHARSGKLFISPAFQSIFSVNNSQNQSDDEVFNINKANFLPDYYSVCRGKRGDLSVTNRWVERCNILHISDNHATSEDGYTNIKEAIKIANLKNMRLNAIVNTGDLTNGFGVGVDKSTVTGTLNKVRDIMLESKVSALALLGNHDANDYGKDPNTALTKKEQWDNIFQGIQDKWENIIYGKPEFVKSEINVNIEQGTWGEAAGDRKPDSYRNHSVRLRSDTAVQVASGKRYTINVNDGYEALIIFFSKFVSNEIGYTGNAVGEYFGYKQSFDFYSEYSNLAVVIRKTDNSEITPGDDHGLTIKSIENTATPEDNGYRHYCFYDFEGDDFGKIRIIMLDQLDHDLPTDEDGNLIYTCQQDPVYSQKQIDWLCDTALKVEDGTGVIICNHYPFDYTPTTDKNESLIIDGKYVQPWDMIPKIVDAWQKRTSLNEIFNDSVGTQNITVNADFSNIGNNCEFITYLCGHTHYKTYKKVKGYNQMMLLEDSSGSYGTGYSSVSRLAGTPTSNAFSILSIDRMQGLIYRTSYGAYKSINETDRGRIEKISYRVNE